MPLCGTVNMEKQGIDLKEENTILPNVTSTLFLLQFIYCSFLLIVLMYGGDDNAFLRRPKTFAQYCINIS